MKAIIVGASSGMGRELAKILAKNGYDVGVVARREELLVSLKKEFPSKITIQVADVSHPEKAMMLVEQLISKMDGVDLAVLSSGVGFLNKDLEWDKEKETIDVNVLGFCTMANVFMKHFRKKGKGHLAAISSIAAFRGSGSYSASNSSANWPSWSAGKGENAGP